jgi:hypothetical protein
MFDTTNSTKFQYEILCILQCTKMTKIEKKIVLKYVIFTI